MEEKILQLFSFVSKLEQATQVRRKVLTDYYDFNPQKIFKILDTENKSFINSDDIFQYLEIHHIPYTEESVQLLILFFDTDFDGVLSFQEFVPLIRNENSLVNKKNNININVYDNMSFNIEYCLTKLFEKEIELNMYIINILSQINNNKEISLQEIFRIISMYKNYITSNDIRNFLDNNKIEYSESQINDIMKRLDINKDGKIDFNEFKLLFKISNKIINNNNDSNNINNYNNINSNKNNNGNYYFDYHRNDNNIKNDNNYNSSLNNEYKRNMNEEENIENEDYNKNQIYDFIRDNENKQILSPTRNNNNNKYRNYCFTTPCCECRANQNLINDYNIENNKYNYSINNNNSDYYFKYNANCKNYIQNNDITNSECNDDILNNNMPYNDCNEFNDDIDNNCYDNSIMNNNYEFPNEYCFQNNINNYEINDFYCCDNDNTNNENCQNLANQVDYNNNKCQNNESIYTPFRIENISDTLSLRTSPRRMQPPDESRKDNYNHRSTYFSPFYHRRPKKSDKINHNYDVDNSNIRSNSEYNFSYKPKNIKKARSQHDLRINRDNIVHSNYNNNYSNSDNNNNSFEKEKKILCHYFKLAMEGESQIELTKVNLILRKDFNCNNFFNLFDEENKKFITFDDMKNELEFIGLPMKNIEIQLLINRFNKTNNNNSDNEEENIIEYDNFCSGLLPRSNKYEDLCNEKIKNRNINESNVFSPTTRLYFKTLIKSMVDLEKKLNKFKKQNINKDTNFIDVLKEIDVSEKGYFGINELIRFLKEHELYSCYKDSELLFNRLDKKERNKVSYDDVFTDLYYL